MDALKQSAPKLKEMANQMKSLTSSGGNINEMLAKTLGQNNPMLQQLMSGGNPEQMVKSMLSQQGIDPTQFMSELQQLIT